MLNGKLMMLALFIVSILMVSAVSAADNATDDAVGMGDATDDVAIEEINIDENLSASEEEAVSSTHTVSGDTYADIQNAINNARDGDTIEISGEYSGGAVTVNRSVNIVGKGDATLNVGSWTAFDIYAKNVNISNLKILDGSMDIHNDEGDLNFRCTNCLFDGKGAYGSGLFIGCNFTNCKYAIYGDSSAINCIFENNGVAEYGARNEYAIYSRGKFDLSIINCTFINNIGGAIYQLWENSLSIINCTFINNTAEEGGAIHIASNENSVRIIDCNFTGNRAEYGYGGGAIYSWGNINELSDCIFIDNHADKNGGAIFSFGDDNAALNCMFINNTCEKDGGAINGFDAIGCIFTGNYASNGGAMYYANAVGCTFKDNNAENDGGAMCCGHAEGCEFIDNSAENGGAISEGSVLNCSFTNNTAGSFGGAVDIASAISDSIFIGNYAQNGGAASRVSNVSNSRFRDNYARSDGGVIYSDRDINVTRCEFANNFANGKGGAIYAISSTREYRDYSDWSIPVTIDDYDDLVSESSYEIRIGETTRFVGNFASNGGAIFVEKTDNVDMDVVNIFAGKLTLESNVAFEGNIAGDVWSIATAETIIGASQDLNNDESPVLGGAGFDFNGGYGGAIYLSDTQFVIDGATFNSNCATGDGGAVYVNRLIVDTDETEGGKSFEYALYGAEFMGNIVASLQLEETSPDRYVLKMKDQSPNNISGAVSMDGKVVTVAFASSYSGKGLVRVISQSGVVIRDFESTFSKGKTQFDMGLLKQDGLAGGNHSLLICYAKNDDACFKLPLSVESNLAVEASDVYCSQSERVTFTLTDNGQAIGGVTIKIDVGGIQKIGKTDSNGRVVMDLNLPAGSYDVVTHYDDHVIDSKLTVKSTVSAANATGEYLNARAEATFLDVDGKPLASRQVTFKIGDNAHATNTNDLGVASSNVNLGAGTYWVTAVNPASGEQKQFTLVIGKANSNIALASSQNKGAVTLTATLTPDRASGNVIFSLDGKNTTVSIYSGKATLAVDGLKDGSHIATAYYNGDSNLKASSSKISFTLMTASKTTISASKVNTVYNGGKYLTITLKDEKGRAISGVKLTVILNGKKKTHTIKNGQVKVSTDGLAPKTYTASIAFDGNAKYQKSSKSVKVTVKKATPKLTAKAKTFKSSVKTKKYTVTLKTNKNKVMKNTKVTLKVKGKTYSAKTNSKGQATFKITKLTKKGKYTAVVKYAGSKYYNSKTAKPKITIK